MSHTSDMSIRHIGIGYHYVAEIRGVRDISSDGVLEHGPRQLPAALSFSGPSGLHISYSFEIITF